MKRKIALILTAVLLGLAVCLPAAAAGAGTADDPLVTLSYLNETFLAAVQKRIDEAVASRNASLTAYIDGKLGSGGGSAGTARSFADAAGGQRGLRLALHSGAYRRDHRGDIGKRQGSREEPSLHDDHRGPGREGRQRHREGAGPGELHH